MAVSVYSWPGCGRQAAEELTLFEQLQHHILTAVGVLHQLDMPIGDHVQAFGCIAGKENGLTLIVTLFDEQGVDMLDLVWAKLREEWQPGQNTQAKVDGTLMRWDWVDFYGRISACRHK